MANNVAPWIIVCCVGMLFCLILERWDMVPVLFFFSFLLGVFELEISMGRPLDLIYIIFDIVGMFAGSGYSEVRRLLVSALSELIFFRFRTPRLDTVNTFLFI